MHTKIVRIWISLACLIVTTAANFTSLGPDELNVILSNLDTRTAANYRLISSKWNAAYKEMTKEEIADLDETESLLRQREQSKTDKEANNEIINQIITIRQRNLLNERYSFNFYSLINKWYCQSGTNMTYKGERL